MHAKTQVVATLAILLTTAPPRPTSARCYAEEFRVPPPATRWSIVAPANTPAPEKEPRHLSDIGGGNKVVCERRCQRYCQSKKSRCRNPAEQEPELRKSAEQVISLRARSGRSSPKRWRPNAARRNLCAQQERPNKSPINNNQLTI